MRAQNCHTVIAQVCRVAEVLRSARARFAVVRDNARVMFAPGQRSGCRCLGVASLLPPGM